LPTLRDKKRKKKENRGKMRKNNNGRKCRKEVADDIVGRAER